MLSSRGYWFLITVVLVLVGGAFGVPHYSFELGRFAWLTVTDYSVVPALLGLTLLGWFCVEWILFHLRSNAAVSRLRVRRQILQGGREVPMVWAGLGFEVRVTIENPGFVGIPFIIIEDRAAVATEQVEGSPRRFCSLAAGGSVEITYTLKSPAPGVLRFEGLTVRVADVNGFFYRRVFLRDPVEMHVLPPLSDDEGKQRATKRFNTLPPPGIHRLRRPGSGSELLDLRDYQPGDPPKMIAWKASARRDKLVTKEFENDIPVRAVIFLDTSEGVRLGPPGNTLLTRLAGVAAAVAQASAANRDLVGLTTFDEKDSRGMSPARTKMHMISVLRRLAEVSSLQPGVTDVPAEQLTRRAYPLAQEIYPELMTKQANAMPLGRLWIPLLDRKWGWLVLLIVLIGPVMFGLFSWSIYYPMTVADKDSFQAKVLVTVRKWTAKRIAYTIEGIPKTWGIPRSPPMLFLLMLMFWFTLIFLVIYWPPGTLAIIFWFIHSCRGWFGERRRELTRRKQLATLFALQDGAGPDAIERYIFDDDLYGVRVAAFLQHHLLRCPVPLYDEDGRYRFRCADKAPVLADAIVRAVSRARDNELYVILADISELGKDLSPVVKAVRVARARHHHILVIVPWPADVPSPDDPDGETPEVVTEEEAPAKPWNPYSEKPKPKKKPKPNRLVTLVRASLTKQYHDCFKAMRRELSRVGATVMRVNDGDPVQLVLDRLDRVRGLRSRR